MLLRLLFIISCALALTQCEQLALITTPKKQPKPTQSALAEKAERQFWLNLHQGNYANIPHVTTLLTAAYLENPNDPKLAAHLGFIHTWKITERARLTTIEPTITDEIILARKYFKDAVALNPYDARFQGFLGDVTLIEGQIFHDERQQVRGYFILKNAIKQWPEFNYFTAGYPMSTLPPDSAHFKEGLAWQWQTLNLCAGTTINKENPDFSPYLKRETLIGPQRACWNSWIAPHNFEGFFLNMGDMLVKSGDWQSAIKVYNNAKLSKTYSSWPYRKMLEYKIQHAKENVTEFQKLSTKNPFSTILFNSGYGCAVCHQQK